jgi:N-terminal domain on NACHT_NTPase and P-loop NTPases
MAGLEVLGGIGAVIAIIDGSVKVWESARKDLKFSETFETVGNRLPILRDILQPCHEHFEPIKTSLPADTVQGLVKTSTTARGGLRRSQPQYPSCFWRRFISSLGRWQNSRPTCTSPSR